MGNIQPTEQSCRQPRELLRADNKKTVTARKNMAPQIIVIPQNLLQQKQTQAKSVLRISPQPKQFRVIASSTGPSNVSPAAGVSKSLRLNTDINNDLDDLLETPNTETMLDNILAETDYIDSKWAQHLDDLFPELD